MTAIQALYAPDFSHCYGCGPRNPHGHHLKSYLVADRTEARFIPEEKYSGGVPGHMYGGMVASLMDCHGAASAAAFAARQDGIPLQAGATLPRFVTASLKVDFHHPTPLGTELLVEGRLRSIDGRKVWIDLRLLSQNQVCASGEMLAIRLK